MRELKPNRRKFWALLGALLVVAIAVGALLSWKSPRELRLPSCPFHTATGLYCPGCGSTRALWRLANGDLRGSLRYNPLTAPFLPLVFVLFVQNLRDLWAGSTKPRSYLRVVALVAFGLFSLFFVLRNIPAPIFDVLRPPQSSAASVCAFF